jgi:hypothetical protein
VTVEVDGGGDCTLVRVRERDGEYTGDWTDWSSGQIQETYDVGVDVDVDTTRDCSCAYDFDEWASEEAGDLDGTPHQLGSFNLTQNTTATAVYDAIILPDQESTTWYEHWTPVPPHLGDVYAHAVSLGSDPNQSFQGLTVNEDFLREEMISSGWTVPTTPDYKEQWQAAWDDDWIIDDQNRRSDAYDIDPDNAYDAHGFIPTVLPWSLMSDGDTFQIKQRMRVKSTCISENNVGPWFETHTILFKLIVNQQTGDREVFVKKSGIQGTGDPQI